MVTDAHRARPTQRPAIEQPVPSGSAKCDPDPPRSPGPGRRASGRGAGAGLGQCRQALEEPDRRPRDRPGFLTKRRTASHRGDSFLNCHHDCNRIATRGDLIQRIPQVKRGGAGGARTHDRQIMRKPARAALALARSLQCLSVLVSRDLPGWGGTGQDAAGRDGCSHSVPIRRRPPATAATHASWSTECRFGNRREQPRPVRRRHAGS
jgi:hypothetical protein